LEQTPFIQRSLKEILSRLNGKVARIIDQGPHSTGVRVYGTLYQAE
jgi:hypothetical protein